METKESSRNYELQRFRRYYAANKAERALYVATPKGRALRKANRQKHREERRVRKIATREIASGRLIPQPCEIGHSAASPCGGKIEMHHHNYQKPLDVNWLCRDHHAYTHRILKATKAAELN